MDKSCTNCKHDTTAKQQSIGILCNKTKDKKLPFAEDENGDCAFFSRVGDKGKCKCGNSRYSIIN